MADKGNTISATPSTAPSQPQTADVVIAALGDSVTKGWNPKLNSPENLAVPAQLENLLRKDGISARVDNYGVSGENSQQCLNRVQAVIEQHPDVAIAACTINDIRQGVAPEQTAKNTAEILAEFRKAHIATIFIGQSPEPTWGPAIAKYEHNHGLPQTHYTAEDYKKLLDKIGADSGLSNAYIPEQLLPAYGNQSNPNAARMQDGDDVHPNPAGASAIANAIAPSVKSVIVLRKPVARSGI